MADKVYVGRRKTSVARVILRNGNGNITIGKKSFEQFFPMDVHREDILKPFQLTDTVGKYDVLINVKGGGISGQAEAVRLGISIGLITINPDFRGVLKAEGFLTRDSRMVERKKYGQKKARKRFQFSKR